MPIMRLNPVPLLAKYRDLVYVDRIEFLDVKGSGNGHRDPAESASDETTATDQEMPF